MDKMTKFISENEHIVTLALCLAAIVIIYAIS